jgi:hypothetical protein
MGRLEDELARLKAQLEAWQGAHELPPEVDLLCALGERHRTRREGLPVAPFAERQLEELYRHDVDMVEGEADVYRRAPGWDDEEAQQLVDDWEEAARRRMEAIENGSSLSEAYETHDIEKEENE